MKINFTDARPQDADVLAFIVTKSTFADFKLPLEKPDIIHATAKLARFEGAAGQNFLLINEQDGKLVRIVLLGVAEGEAADYQKVGGDIIAKVQTSGAKHVAVHGANMTAQHAVEVAFGAALRNWRMDKYRTKLPETSMPTVVSFTVVAAPAEASCSAALSAASVACASASSLCITTCVLERRLRAAASTGAAAGEVCADTLTSTHCTCTPCYSDYPFLLPHSSRIRYRGSFDNTSNNNSNNHSNNVGRRAWYVY
jgi:hypothetical protein